MSEQTITAVGFSVDAGRGSASALETSLRRIADLGADVAELSLYGYDVIAGGRIVEARAREIAAICARVPLRYTVHGQIVSNFMDGPHLGRQKAVVSAMLDLCGRIGATVLVQHGGRARLDARPGREALDRMERDALAEMAEVAQRHGVRIALENIFGTSPDEYRQTPAELTETVRAVDHPNLVGLVDVGHAYIEGTRTGFDWRAEVKAFSQVAGHLHLHDNFGQPPAPTPFYHPSEAVALGIGDLHLPLGWGDIPFEAVAGDLDVLPGTMMILELGERFDTERAESLAEARRLAAIVNARSATRTAA
ncbi:TIM barrel protein [Aureimonas pseudogalii]|uniref:Sugar phosphate isomerase/epimerase n=1 Tax=Aureimonas pseudogalii TaxID=1744844 RepID=A0A7W6H2G2_9HYPH|nr:TIM barrel protein [Aureimonas pseudogalii]MBB3996605.1 sugar phosphate isomerase/epimerase [Aureimonas pseudogalii]